MSQSRSTIMKIAERNNKTKKRKKNKKNTKLNTLFIFSDDNLSPIITDFRQAREANTAETRASRVTVPVGHSRSININS